MIEHLVDASQPRVQRRRWSDESKSRIVAESFAPGAIVLEVARRYGLSPSQLSAWRKAARNGLLKPPDGTRPAATVPTGMAAIPDVSASGREASGVLSGPGPGHEFIKPRGGPKIDQLGENVGQVGLRFDAAELTALDQRSDAGPVLRALIMPREQCILAIENKRADASLDDIGVELDATVVEEPGEPVPVVQGVPDIPGDRRLAGDAGELQFEPVLERQHERLAAVWRTARRSSALRPLIVFSIA